jgi:hypothetical protein
VNLLREKQRLSPMGGRLYKGGGGQAGTQSNPVTTNRDNRLANNGGTGVSGDGNLTMSSADSFDYSTTIVSSSDPETLQKLSGDNAYVAATLAEGQTDAVKALTNFGAQMVRDSQEAIVDLNATSTAANKDIWDATINMGADLVDRLINQSTTLGTAAISSFQPTEKSNADIGKYAMWAVAAVAAAVLLKGSK